jgi:hypothetical protein
LEVVGETDLGRTYPSGGKNFVDREDPNWVDFSATLTPLDRQLVKKNAKYHSVRAIDSAIELSIKKMDVGKTLPEKDDIYQKTFNVMLIALAYIKNARPLKTAELFDFNRDTSPGLPWIKLGFKTKGDVLSTAFNTLMEFCWRFKEEFPVCTYNDKTEFLPEEDLNRNKVRGTFGASMHYVLREKMVYGGQNKALKDGHQGRWIQYGVVKQYGGFHRAMKPLEKMDITEEGDISGFDRTAPLDPVYDLREALMDTPPFLREMQKHVREFNTKTLVLLPNGKIVRRKTGNASGHASTTCDNSILHLFILVYLFVGRLYEIGRPETEITWRYICENCIYRIYSDDKLGGVKLASFEWDVKQFVESTQRAYKKFGMVIKDSATLLTYVMKEGSAVRINPRHSFLGSFCFYSEEDSMYLPIPRLEKICSSLVYQPLNKLNKTEYFARLIALTGLVAHVPVYLEIMVKYLGWFQLENLEFAEDFAEQVQTQNLVFSDRSSFGSLNTGHESAHSDEAGPDTPAKENQVVKLGGLKIRMSTINEVLNGEMETPTPTRREVSRGKRTLANLVADGRMSLEDVAYLKIATDPWHDTKVDNFTGIPDEYCGESITEPQTMSINLKTPYLAGSGNWNARIVTYPFVGVANLTGGNLAGSTIYQGSAITSNKQLWSCTIDYSDTDVFPAIPAVAHTLGLTIAASVATGDTRVAGCGLEVVNTTAEIYKQGLLTVSRMPQTASGSTRSYLQTKVGVIPTVVTDLTVQNLFYVQSAPNSVDELLKYPGVVQWAAAEGQYSVINQYAAGSCEPKYANANPIVFNRTTPNSGNTTVESVFSPTLEQVATGGFAYQPLKPISTVIPNPCDMIVSIYSGLSENSTLAVKFRQIIERRVTVTVAEEASLVPLAKNSPPFNPAVLELVAAVQAGLPPAVMFKENPAGEWWEKVLGIVGDVAVPILGSIPHPLAQAAAGVGRKLLDNRQQKSLKERINDDQHNEKWHNMTWKEKQREMAAGRRNSSGDLLKGARSFQAGKQTPAKKSLPPPGKKAMVAKKK